MSRPQAGPRPAGDRPDDDDAWCWYLIGAFALAALAAVWVPVWILS